DKAVVLSDRVVVFTARPGRIETIVPIDVDRPRNLFAPECEKLRRELTAHLKNEVERAFAEHEAFATTPLPFPSSTFQRRCNHGKVDRPQPRDDYASD